MPAPFVSVLMPTRARPHLCLESVRSLVDTALEPARIEFLFRRDVSDTTVYPCEEIAGLVAKTFGAVWMWAAARGYRGLHTYYNELAKRAQGAWLLVWNDDAMMRTEGWDEHLAQDGNTERALLAQHHSHFPAITASWHHAVGHVSQSPHADTYLAQIAETLVERATHNTFVPIVSPSWEIDHLADQLDDEGTERRKREILGPEGTSAEFFSPAMQQKIRYAAFCLSPHE